MSLGTLTIANASRLSQDGNSSHTGVLDVFDLGDNLATLIRLDLLASIDEKLQVAVADASVLRDKLASASSTVAAHGQTRGDSVLECVDGLVGVGGSFVNNILSVLELGLGGAFEDGVGLGKGGRAAKGHGGGDGGEEMHGGIDGMD